MTRPDLDRDVTTPADLGFSSSKFPSFRPGQLEEARRAIDPTRRRFQILDAPTGTGKSLLYMAAAALLPAGSRTLILVSTKTLQDQLAADFGRRGSLPGTFDMRGQSNYECLALSDELSLFGRPGAGCDQGPCHHGVVCSLREGGCLYFDAREEARHAPVVVTNYAYWMSMNRYGDAEEALGKFNFLVCDEAHRAPDLLTDFCAVRVIPRRLGEELGVTPPRGRELDLWRDWAKKIGLPAARDRYKEARGGRSAGTIRRLRRLKNLGRDLAALAQASDDWVVEGTRFKSITFSPVWGRDHAEEYLFADIPRVLLTSATLNPVVAKRLHIGKFEHDFTRMPSTFAPANRPVVWVPTVKMRHGISEGELARWAQRIDEVIEARLEAKGIIQTKSYDRAEDVVARSRFSDHMISHARGEAEEAIARFKAASAPAILVSPSVEEGHDFYGDQCRYQIIAKLPFIYSKSPMAAARQAEDSSYLNSVAAESLVQISGRSTRSPDDWSEVFIIDDQWKWFRHAAKKTGCLPAWFEAALAMSATVPTPMTGAVEESPITIKKKRRIRPKPASGRRRTA